MPTEQEIVSKGLDTKQAESFHARRRCWSDSISARISLGGPVFDLVKLRWMNGEYLRKLSPDDFFAAMRATVFSDAYLKAIAPLVQTRIETLGAFGDMADFFFKDNVMPAESVWVPKKRTPEETLAFAAEQLTVLEAAAWDAETIEAEMKKLGRGAGLECEGELHAAARDHHGKRSVAAADGFAARLRQGAIDRSRAAIHRGTEEARFHAVSKALILASLGIRNSNSR